MSPTLKPGQTVWVFQWAYLFSKPQAGEVVVFEKEGKEMVKRITEVRDNAITVVGDNKVDSLEVGSVPVRNIVGRVLG